MKHTANVSGRQPCALNILHQQWVINSRMDPAWPRRLQYTDLCSLLSCNLPHTHRNPSHIQNNKTSYFMGTNYFNASHPKQKRHPTDHLVSCKKSHFILFLFSFSSFISKVCNKNNIGIIFHIKITMRKKKTLRPSTADSNQT